MGQFHGYSEETTDLHEEFDVVPEVAAGGKMSLIPKSLWMLNFSHNCNLYSRIQFLDASLLVKLCQTVFQLKFCLLELLFVCIT